MIDPEFENTINRLNEGWMGSFRERAKARRSGDQKGFDDAGRRMVEFYQELKAELKAEGRKFEAETKLDPAANDDAKVEQLLTAFARGTRLTRIWRDVMQETRISVCCGNKVADKVGASLRALGRREDLVKFLDDKDPSTRATAASWLVGEMPDRCLPILTEISKSQWFLAAGLTAYWTLRLWEHGAIPKYQPKPKS
jgi:hypothetical protein